MSPSLEPSGGDRGLSAFPLSNGACPRNRPLDHEDVIPTKERFSREAPGAHFLEASDLPALSLYLRSHGWLAEGEVVTAAAKAGEGNMNYTLRVITPRRSFIVKQARPWVEKYPHIAAPFERGEMEIRFYRLVAGRPAVRDAMPRLLGGDPTSGVLVLEDLGEARDFTAMYRGLLLADAELTSLVSYLAALHRPFPNADRSTLRNRAMRALNHEHIFRLPLARDNGLDLERVTPGLAGGSTWLKEDERYLREVTELGALYLAEDGEALLHGDYFPGSWLQSQQGVRVIDPEFCFFGPAAFDLGCMLAHLYLSDQSTALIERLLPTYRELSGHPVSEKQVRQFAGVEIMRRLLGVAQLPLSCGLEKKNELLGSSRSLVLG